MRILLTVHQYLPKYFSGTEVLTRDTGLEMRARGHEVHVLTVDPSAGIDVLVVPSVWHENAPLVIHSALAAGVPVVGSNQEGIAELIDEEKNGLLLDAGDAADLARQLKRLIAEPGLLAQLGRVGNPAKTVEESVDEVLALYKKFQRKAVI
jgi:glycosyltransferase involved in cell wall biosynthesis